jgi:GntR family transcriptional regulator
MFPKLNPKSPKPLYSQVKEAITDYIELNNLQPNDPLPSERELAEVFQISRLTVRKALNLLIQDGVAFQQAGKGTYISSPKLQQRLLVLTSFTEAVTQEGHTVGTQLLDFEMKEGRPSLYRALELEPGKPVLVVRRLRFVDGSPFSIATSYLPCELAQGISAKDMQSHSLYGLLDARCGIRLAKTHAFLEAASADSYEAGLLNIKPGSPLFLMKGTARSAAGLVVEYFEVYYRGDRLRFSAESD